MSALKCDTEALKGKVSTAIKAANKQLNAASFIVSGLPVLEGCEEIAKIPEKIDTAGKNVIKINIDILAAAEEFEQTENGILGWLTNGVSWLVDKITGFDDETEDNQEAVTEISLNPVDREKIREQKLDDIILGKLEEQDEQAAEQLREYQIIKKLAKQDNIDTNGKTKRELLEELANVYGVSIFKEIKKTIELDWKLYDQTKYGNIPLGINGESTIAEGGCQIGSLAYVGSWSKNLIITPDILLQEYIPELNKCYKKNEGIGQEPLLNEEYLSRLNLKYEGMYWGNALRGEKKLIEALENGCVAIWRTHSDYFATSNGHYLAVPGITEEGNIMLFDPNGANWTKANLKEGFKNGFDPKWLSRRGGCYYVFSKIDENNLTENIKKDDTTILNEIMAKIDEKPREEPIRIESQKKNSTIASFLDALEKIHKRNNEEEWTYGGLRH